MRPTNTCLVSENQILRPVISVMAAPMINNPLPLTQRTCGNFNFQSILFSFPCRGVLSSLAASCLYSSAIWGCFLIQSAQDTMLPRQLPSWNKKNQRGHRVHAD
jgi:hypothetical protein